MERGMLLLVHAAATWFMVGLIWFVQVVHYPLMLRVGREVGCEYEAQHMRRTTWVVGPVMLVEAITAVTLLVFPPVDIDPWTLWLSLGLLGVIWLLTASTQVRQHKSLCSDHNPDVIRALVRYNWPRTIAWTARGGLVAWMLF